MIIMSWSWVFLETINKIHLPFWQPKVQYRFHKTSQFDPNLNLKSAVHSHSLEAYKVK